jgi:hypothetical protein
VLTPCIKELRIAARRFTGMKVVELSLKDAFPTSSEVPEELSFSSSTKRSKLISKTSQNQIALEISIASITI